MIEVSVLVDKINEMSSQQIGLFLEGQQMVGTQSDEYACPLARWIHKESGRFISVGKQHQLEDEITYSGVAVFHEECIDPEACANYEFLLLGAGPLTFIHDFDEGLFPALVEEIDEYDV